MSKGQTIILGSFFLINISLGQPSLQLYQQAKDFLAIGDFKNAIPLLNQSAKLGNTEAQYHLALCYQQGTGVAKNDTTANLWLLKAANNGSKDAQSSLSTSFAVGRGILQDEYQAFYWTSQCAKNNDAQCMSNIIDYYRDGIGIEPDLDSMVAWSSRLALLDNMGDIHLLKKITAARLSLVKMYHEGDIIPKDLFKSYVWLLIYNENKKDQSLIVQQTEIDEINELEKLLDPSDKSRAKEEAENLLKTRLSNLDNLYQQEL